MNYFKTLIPKLEQCSEKYSIFYETKSNLEEHHIKALSSAGIKWIQPGIESLHDAILKKIDKGNTALGNVLLLKTALEYGIRLSWNLLFGVPGERDEWYEEMASWLPLISHLQPPSSMVRIRYDRFSPYHMDPSRFGISSISPNKAYSAVYPLKEHELRDLAYFFEDYEDQSRGCLDRPAIGRVKDWLLAWGELFAGRKRPTLVMVEGQTGTLLWDGRPCARESLIVLDGLRHAVHHACRRPRSRESLLRELPGETGQPVASGELEEAVRDLVERRLLLRLGGKMLSLATRVPRLPLASMFEYPGGFYKASEWEG